MGAKYVIDEYTLKNIADSIREKTGNTLDIAPEGMAEEILRISGTSTPTQEKTVDIKTNGIHEVLPDEGYALSKVTANVDIPVGEDVSEETAEYTVKLEILETAITDLEVALRHKESVQPITEPLTVTENGTYRPSEGVDGYSVVNVNVPIPDGYIQPSGTLEVTENGTYDITEYASVDVNISPGTSETWTFIMEDGTEVVKEVVVV